jgi:hypothetical protein
MIRDLSDGSETTTTAVHISAVHHASIVLLVLDKNDTRTEVGRWKRRKVQASRLTTNSIGNVVV